MNNSTTKRKLIIGGIIAFLVLMIGVVIYQALPKTQILLSVAPGTVQLSIDGKEAQTVRNEQKITLSPGDHTLSFSEEEFDSYVKKVTLKENEVQEVLVALNPLTTTAQEKLLDKKSEEIVQKFKGDEFEELERDITADYPIIKDLPVDARYYYLAACQSEKYPDDKSKIAICAYVYRIGLEEYVRKHITTLGYNPDDYEIIYHIRYEDE